MFSINLTVTSDTVTETLNITPQTTWIDLCGSLLDYAKISVTQVYYQDHEGDVIALSSDREWESLKRQCHTGWIHLSTDPSKVARWVFDDTFIKRGPSHSTPLPSTHRLKIKPDFTSQFEQFGRIMDKYNDLIQQDNKLKQMMQNTATDITLQSGTIDLTQIETHLERLSRTNRDPPSQPLYPQYDTTSLDNAPATPRRRSLSTNKYDSSSNVYPDAPPPSYEPSDEKKKDQRRRHTHYGPLDRQIPASSWGEWPAYSSLHPPPAPPSPLPIPSAPSEPALNEALSIPTLQHHHHHHHHHHSPRSLYPRPPVLLPAIIKRTSRLLSHWVPPSDSDDRRRKQQERADSKAQKKEQKHNLRHEKRHDRKERRQKGKQKETGLKESSSSSSLSTCSSLDRSPFHYPAIPPSLLPHRTQEDGSTDDIQRLTTSLGRLSTKVDTTNQYAF